jgi:hypothetical protein
MRACFLGQNVCALGFGVATLQSPPLLLDEQTGQPVQRPGDKADRKEGKRPLEAPQTGPGPL